jgi:hypothetical protein
MDEVKGGRERWRGRGGGGGGRGGGEKERRGGGGVGPALQKGHTDSHFKAMLRTCQLK